MPCAPSRQKLIEEVEVIGVVQDEQPLLVRLKPVFHRFNDDGLILLVLLGQVQELCQGSKAGDEGIAGVSLYPQDGTVRVFVPVSVFKRRSASCRCPPGH